MRNHSIKFKEDSRIWILVACLITSMNVLIHYGLINPNYRSSFYSMMEFERFLIMYSVCIYYIYRVHRIIENLSKVTIGLSTFGVVSFLTYVFIEVYVSSLE